MGAGGRPPLPVVAGAARGVAVGAAAGVATPTAAAAAGKDIRAAHGAPVHHRAPAAQRHGTRLSMRAEPLHGSAPTLVGVTGGLKRRYEHPPRPGGCLRGPPRCA